MDRDARMKSEDAELIRCRWVLFPRNQVQFPALTWWLTTITASSEDLTPPHPGLTGQSTLTCQQNTYIYCKE